MEKTLICPRCGQAREHSHEGYCRACKSEYNKSYRASHLGFYLYAIIDKNGYVVYVGKTVNLQERIYAHIGGNSNIGDYMVERNWERIMYLDLTGVLYTNEDLLFMEEYFISQYNPALNKAHTDLNELHLKDDWIDEMYNIASDYDDILLDWSTYKVNSDLNIL